jgi:hypothetical protein
METKIQNYSNFLQNKTLVLSYKLLVLERSSEALFSLFDSLSAFLRMGDRSARFFALK